jgi:putative ABC transport system permease protein
MSELRLACRMVMRRPVIAAAVVLPLGLAIALNSALFAVLDGLLFRPLPFDRPDELVALDFRSVGGTPPAVAYLPALQDRRIELRDGISAALASSAQAGRAGFFAEAAAVQEGIRATGVDARFFGLLGLKPVLGSGFSEDDEQRPAVRSRQSDEPLPVIIGHTLWQQRFGGDPGVLGVHEIAGRRVRVVGVMGPGVKFPGETNLWAPVDRGRQTPPAYGRLAPGTSVAQLASRFPELQITPLGEAVRPGDSTAVVFLFVVAGLLLLLAWVQVAALTFSGALGRIQEVGVRLALGASGARLARQFALENVLLAGAAAALAWLFAAPLTTLIVRYLPPALTHGQYLAPDPRTVAFTGAISLIGIVCLTVLPLDVVRRGSPLRLLAGRIGDAPVRSDRTRQVLLTAQLALTAALLYMAGLAVHSFARLTTVDYGFDAENVLVFTPAVPPGAAGSGRPVQEFFANSAALARQLDEAAESLMRMPGVVAAERISAVPLQRERPREYEIKEFDGQPVVPPAQIHHTLVGPRFTQALGATIVAGDDFNDPEYAGATNVAVINETLARRLSVNNIAGFEIRRSVLDRIVVTSSRQRFRVIGVVKDLVQSSPAAVPEPHLFSPILSPGALVIRVSPPAEEALAPVRAVLERTFDQPPRHFGLLRDELHALLLPYRAQSLLLGLIAAFCLPLAAIGLTGALMYFVQVRSRETAIRLALGADPASVRRAVVLRALVPVGMGIVLGTALGIAVGRVVASELFQVQPADPITMVAVSLALVGLAWLSALLPARHACRIDPAAALRDP